MGFFWRSTIPPEVWSAETGHCSKILAGHDDAGDAKPVGMLLGATWVTAHAWDALLGV